MCSILIETNADNHPSTSPRDWAALPQPVQLSNPKSLLAVQIPV